jgi:hypothetical protein
MKKIFILALLSIGVLSANVSAGITKNSTYAPHFPHGISIIVKVSGMNPDSYKVIIKDGQLRVSSDNLDPNGDKESFYFLTHLPNDINGENIIYSIDKEEGLLNIGFKYK